MSELILDEKYKDFLNEIKQRYQQAQLKAVHAVNQEMIRFYWNVGKQIIDEQAQTIWGSKFIEQLSRDLQITFPGTKGFSVANIKRMRRFAELYPDFEISAQAVRQLPWGHIILLMQQVKEAAIRDWYAINTIKNGISRNILAIQIKQDLYSRQGKSDHKLTNFKERLPLAQSDLALQLFKDPYDFRFLPITEEAKEQEVEQAMTQHLSKLLLELGRGFAYMGNQYKLSVDGRDYFLDMLFYNVNLRCFFVCELKAVELEPEHIGKLNFYLAIVDDILKAPDDNPSIGLLLCRKKSKLVAEYSLKRTDGPIGVAEYQLLHKLPKKLSKALPSTDVLEEKLKDINIDE